MPTSTKLELNILMSRPNQKQFNNIKLPKTINTTTNWMLWNTLLVEHWRRDCDIKTFLCACER